jgi:hypothetical protein
MSNGVLDVLDIKDVCKYLKHTKAEFLYYPCKTILSMSSTYMDGVTSNLPQLCLNLSNPHTSAVVNSGIILGLLGVLISGSCVAIRSTKYGSAGMMLPPKSSKRITT